MPQARKPNIGTLRNTPRPQQEETMQSQQLLQPSWPLYSNTYSGLDHTGLYGFAMDTTIADQHDFSSSFTTEDDSAISFDSYFASTVEPDSLIDFPSFSDEKQTMETMTRSIMEGLQPISSGGIEDDCRWIDESDSDDRISSHLTSEADVWSPCPVLEQSKSATMSSSNNITVDLPGNNMELDNQVVLHHLLGAYGEAIENGHRELSEVIVKRINERINPFPFGEPIERVAFNLFQTTENQGGYIRQQSSKNFEAAFKAFYQCYPFGRFAHFAANSAIFEAIPKDAEMVHIVDLDMGEGIQWPPMIQAISRTGKTLRITSIKPEGERSTPVWRFEETRQRLFDHARSLGLCIQIQETTMETLWTEIKMMKEANGFTEWTAFNCMVGLPHMGNRRSRTEALKFLRMAKELLAYPKRERGIIAFGDGEAEDNFSSSAGYASFFSGQLSHYQALLESMECNFPICLSEARIAMESLFVAPYISSVSWFQQWKEIREDHAITQFDGKSMSKGNLIEAQEIVNEKESSYKVKIGGQKQNEMALEWKGISLVRVSTWA